MDIIVTAIALGVFCFSCGVLALFAGVYLARWTLRFIGGFDVVAMNTECLHDITFRDRSLPFTYDRSRHVNQTTARK